MKQSNLPTLDVTMGFRISPLDAALLREAAYKSKRKPAEWLREAAMMRLNSEASKQNQTQSEKKEKYPCQPNLH